MIKKIFVILAIFIICFSCGKKNDPEYKSQKNYFETLHIV